MKGKFSPDKKQKLMIMVCAGILLMVIFFPVSKKQQEDTAVPAASGKEDGGTLDAYVRVQERRLKGIIEKIDGAGKVYVMITAKASGERIVEKDLNQTMDEMDETDGSGGARNAVNKSSSEVTVYGDKGTDPYVVKEMQPEIEGVVVAASGADDIQVVSDIMAAVRVLFDVPAHKIKVVKME